MPTSYSARTSPTTTWGASRLGGVYLQDWNGDYILDWQGERIIVVALGGDLPLTTWNDYRTYTFLTWDDLGTQTWDDIGAQTWEDQYSGILPATYTARTPI